MTDDWTWTEEIRTDWRKTHVCNADSFSQWLRLKSLSSVICTVMFSQEALFHSDTVGRLVSCLLFPLMSSCDLTSWPHSFISERQSERCIKVSISVFHAGSSKTMRGKKLQSQRFPLVLVSVYVHKCKCVCVSVCVCLTQQKTVSSWNH